MHPPEPMCTRCHSEILDFEPVSGTGTIYACAVVRSSIVPEFEIPFTCIAVELDEQPGLLLLTNLVGTENDNPSVGARVRVVFESVEEGLVIPQFALAEGL
jgi:uncharacterized OB-fold protein